MWPQTHRYIFFQTALATAGFAAAIAAVVWLVYSLRFFDLLAGDAASGAALLWLMALNLPRFLATALPVALFCAVSLVVARLAADSELVALRAAGLSDATLAAAPLLLSAIVAALIGLLTLWVAPTAATAARQLNHELRTQFPLGALRAGSFQSPQPGLTLFAAEVDAEGRLHGLLLRDDRDGAGMTLTARLAWRADGRHGSALVMLDGTRQDEGGPTTPPTIIAFERLFFPIATLAGPAPPRRIDPAELPTGRLLRPGGALPDAPPGTQPDAASRLRAELHYRLALPLLAPAMAVLALLPLVAQRSRRDGRTPLAVATGAAISVQAAVTAARWTAARHPWLLAALYLVPLMPLAAFAAAIVGPVVMSIYWHRATATAATVTVAFAILGNMIITSLAARDIIS
ncbi:MAG: LptF/LptG family permease, partial [Alphaproteobacteria bacterium]